MSANRVCLTLWGKLTVFPFEEMENGRNIADGFMWPLCVVMHQPCIDLLLDDRERLCEIDASAEQTLFLKGAIEPFTDGILLRGMGVGEKLDDVLPFVELDAVAQILRPVVIENGLDGFPQQIPNAPVIGQGEVGIEGEPCRHHTDAGEAIDGARKVQAAQQLFSRIPDLYDDPIGLHALSRFGGGIGGVLYTFDGAAPHIAPCLRVLLEGDTGIDVTPLQPPCEQTGDSAWRNATVNGIVEGNVVCNFRCTPSQVVVGDLCNSLIHPRGRLRSWCGVRSARCR